MILEADHSGHKYFINYSDPVTLRGKVGWFKEDDVTSVTKEENDQQQKAKSDSGRQNATYTGHEADSPGQPAKLSRTDNASFLEASIDQIISSEKLYGDTFNLYIDILRNNRAFGEKNWGVAKNFYPLSYRPVETSTYSKHILLGNSSWGEYEQLMVPVHLPTENHWLLVVISVFRMYAFTFKILLLQHYSNVPHNFSCHQRRIYQKRTSLAL